MGANGRAIAVTTMTTMTTMTMTMTMTMMTMMMTTEMTTEMTVMTEPRAMKLAFNSRLLET